MAILECSAILFDCDGVLVNSIGSVERQWRKFAERHGLDPEHVIHTAHGHRTVETVHILMPDVDAVAEAAIVERNEIEDTEGLVAIEGAAELLRSLPRDRWAVVTSGTRALATRRLAVAGLPQPEHMVPADEVTRGKPDPEPYLKGARLIGFAPKTCLVFEDAPSGIKSAKAAGAKVIGVPGTYTAEDLKGADGLVRSLRDVSARMNGSGMAVEIRTVDSSGR
ncbi:MAG: HAD family hydrolase [Terriglobales bacterium]